MSGTDKETDMKICENGVIRARAESESGEIAVQRICVGACRGPDGIGHTK